MSTVVGRPPSAVTIGASTAVALLVVIIPLAAIFPLLIGQGTCPGTGAEALAAEAHALETVIARRIGR